MADICRFCLSENNDKVDPLIQPCACIGSVAFVHTNCLSIWRRATTVDANKYICQLCNTHYILIRKWPEETLPSPNCFWDVFLSNSIAMIGLAYYIYLFACTHIVRFYTVESKIVHQNLLIFNSILAVQTFFYFMYYATLFIRIQNMSLYLKYGFFDITRFFIMYVFLITLTQYTIIPTGGMYIYLLKAYRDVHIRILNTINRKGEP